MSYYLIIFLISSNLFLITTCLIIHKERTKENEEICTKNHFRSISMNKLRICYTNNNQDRSIIISFTIDKILYNIFHFYRFILRSIDDISLSTINIYKLTNFTELKDLNNSLKILNLDSGQYEVCIDFQTNSTSYIYSPRYGCIPIRIGELLHGSFKQSSTELLIALTTGIIIFLILCHIIRLKNSKKQLKNHTNKIQFEQRSSRSSSILSTTLLKKQRDRIIRKIFRRHMNESCSSQMQQWARNRAFRHRISTQEQDIQYIKPIVISSNNNIYTIPIEKSLKNFYF